MFKRSLKNLVTGDRNTESVDVMMDSRDMMPMASSDCIGCGRCADNCPTKAIVIDDVWKVDLGKCIFCMDCEMVCENGCISEIPAPDYSLSRDDLIFYNGKDIGSVEKEFDKSIRKMFGSSVAIRELDSGSCNACEIELNNMSNQFYDAGRFGIKVVASPRHADILLVTGPMCNNMLEASLKTYDATPEPKMVVASGACAISGGMFVKGDVTGEGVDDTLKVSMYIPGCPPAPDRVIRSLIKALRMRH